MNNKQVHPIMKKVLNQFAYGWIWNQPTIADKFMALLRGSVEKMSKQKLEEQFEIHDCHLSPEDSCAGCEEWFEKR